MSKEIVMAGVRYNNIVYDGFNHGECFKKLPIDANMVDIEQGFITNYGEFVDRKKAFTIARKAHQLEYDYGIQKVLISEDIHINWLHKKDKTIADLEAKLAESEERCDKQYSKIQGDADYIYKLEKELEQRKEMFIALQEQCAKDIKEKEIEIHCWKCSAKDYKKHHEKALDDLVRITNKVDQHKNSFCIEKLEHLRNAIDNKIYYCYGDNNINIVINKNKFNEVIDNQINQLKEK